MTQKSPSHDKIGQALLWAAALILCAILMTDTDRKSEILLLMTVLASVSTVIGFGGTKSRRSKLCKASGKPDQPSTDA